MSQIHLGVTALRAAQAGLNTAAQNIANASTEGYHRQRVDLVDRQTYHIGQNAVTGGGVDVAQITRLRNSTVEQSLTANISGREAATAQLGTLQQIEQALTPGEGSIHALVTEFFDRVEQLAANPSEPVLRQELVSTAGQLAEAISQISESIGTFGGGLESETAVAVDAVNKLAKQIAEVNTNLRVAASSGHSTNSLLDQRDRLINELATYVDVDPTSLLNGADPLVAAGGALIIYEVTTTISVHSRSDGGFQLASSTGQTGIDVRGGKLGGLMESARVIGSGIGGDFSE
jgi:flagellar hook-associated protein 1